MPPLPQLPEGGGVPVAAEARAVTPPLPDTLGSAATSRGPRATATSAEPVAPTGVGTTRTSSTFGARMAELEAVISEAGAVLADPERQIPPLRAGQTLVRVRDARNRTVEHEIVSVDGERITLREVGGSSPRTLTRTRAELARDLLDPVGGLEVHTARDIDSPRVPSEPEAALLTIRNAELERSWLRVNRDLNPRAMRVFESLVQRRGELTNEMQQAKQELVDYLREHGGISSVGRAFVAGFDGLLFNRSLDQILHDARDAEYIVPAPQREKIASVQRRMDEVDRALVSVRNTGAINFTPENDGVAIHLARWQGSSEPTARLADQLNANLGLIQGALNTGEAGVADGFAAYASVVQPYLHLKGARGESLSTTADGRATLLWAVNSLIGEHQHGFELFGSSFQGRPFVTSARQLTEMRGFLAGHWDEIVTRMNNRNGGQATNPGSRAVFDARRFDAEVARIAGLEAAPTHRELAPLAAQANGQFQKLRDLEPGYLATAGSSALQFINSPETIAFIAATYLTAGTGAVLLGFEGATAASVLTAARAARVTERGIAALTRTSAMFAAATAVDGTIVHTGVNLFNAAIGQTDRVDFSPGAYLTTITMMGASDLIGMAHLQRVARQSPGLRRAFGEHARYLTEESVAMAAIAASSGGDFSENLWVNAQMGLAMRFMHAARRPGSVRTEAPLVAAGRAALGGAQRALGSVRAPAVREPAPAVETDIVVTARRPSETESARAVTDVVPSAEVPLTPAIERVLAGVDTQLGVVTSAIDDLAAVSREWRALPNDDPRKPAAAERVDAAADRYSTATTHYDQRRAGALELTARTLPAAVETVRARIGEPNPEMAASSAASGNGVDGPRTTSIRSSTDVRMATLVDYFATFRATETLGIPARELAPGVTGVSPRVLQAASELIRGRYGSYDPHATNIAHLGSVFRENVEDIYANRARRKVSGATSESPVLTQADLDQVFLETVATDLRGKIGNPAELESAMTAYGLTAGELQTILTRNVADGILHPSADVQARARDLLVNDGKGTQPLRPELEEQAIVLKNSVLTEGRDISVATFQSGTRVHGILEPGQVIHSLRSAGCNPDQAKRVVIAMYAHHATHYPVLGLAAGGLHPPDFSVAVREGVLTAPEGQMLATLYREAFSFYGKWAARYGAHENGFSPAQWNEMLGDSAGLRDAVSSLPDYARRQLINDDIGQFTRDGFPKWTQLMTMLHKPQTNADLLRALSLNAIQPYLNSNIAREYTSFEDARRHMFDSGRDRFASHLQTMTGATGYRIDPSTLTMRPLEPGTTPYINRAWYIVSNPQLRAAFVGNGATSARDVFRQHTPEEITRWFESQPANPAAIDGLAGSQTPIPAELLELRLGVRDSV